MKIRNATERVSLRADEVDHISSYCFKHVTDLMIYYIMNILNLMLSHGHIPVNFLQATFVLIQKSSRLDFSVSANYRAIAHIVAYLVRLYTKLY